MKKIVIKSEVTHSTTNSEMSQNSFKPKNPISAVFKGSQDLNNLHKLNPLRKKKVYTPNIPVKREKNTTSNIESLEGKKSNNAIKFQPKKRRHRGKEFIQVTGSLFGQGIAASSLPKTRNYERQHGSANKDSSIQKTFLSSNATYNEAVEEEWSDELLLDDFIDDFLDDPEDKKGIANKPIILPMLPMGIKSEKHSKIFPIKHEIDSLNDVKQEPIDEIDNEAKIENFEDTFHGSIGSRLTNPSSDVFFFQLPNSLPCHSRDTTDSQHKTSSESISQKSQKQLSDTCSLRDIPEGKIGKLKVYASGRVQMCLGDHIFNLNRGTTPALSQDAIRVQTNSDERNGAFTALAHVKDSFVATPDYYSLISNAKNS